MPPIRERYLQKSRAKIGEATTVHFAPQVPQEKRGCRHMDIRKATKNPSEIRPRKTQIYKYWYVHMKGRRVECRRKNAQGNYKPFKYGYHASRR